MALLVDSRGSYTDTSMVDQTVLVALQHFGFPFRIHDLAAGPLTHDLLENWWTEYIHLCLPGWLIPSKENGAITQFFEGLPKGASIPWEVWVVPLLWNFLLVAAFVFACFCVSMILH